jgi:hypothetical protein
MPGTRVIGRILSMGYPLPGVQVDNYNLLSAPSLFDYDALVVEPHATARYVEDVLSGIAEGRTFGGARVVKDNAVPGEVAIGDVLARRRDEVTRLLDRGGVVVAFAYPPEPLGDGPRLQDWLPFLAADEQPLLVRAEGSQAHIVDHQHSLAAYVSSQLANIAYRAEAAPDCPRGVDVFARSAGGAALGFELPLPAGRIILLPALKATPAGDKRYAASDVLQAGIRRALGVMAAGKAPPWVLTQTPLPGLRERTEALERARLTSAAAHAELQRQEAAVEELARFQALLWQEGALGLEPIVFEALRLLGVEVYDRDPRELEIKAGEVSALVEIDASEQPIDMAVHHRLRQRIERAIERRGVAPRGVIFVNGQRLQPPTQRQHVTDSLRTAAETLRYCVAPTPTLYHAVVAHLEGNHDAGDGFVRALVATDGLLP